MEKQKEKIPFKQRKKLERGITLIALVITIIVLLILAGISIATLTGENGILTRSNEAKVETRGGAVQEARDLWKTNQESDKQIGTSTAQTLDELLADLEKQNLLTSKEVAEVKETGKVTIGKRTIVFVSNGMTLVEMFDKAIADGCTNEDGSCTNEEHLHVGDYVNFQNPKNAEYQVSAEKVGLNEVKDSNNKYLTNQKFVISENFNQLNWRVLGKDKETKGIKITSGRPLRASHEEEIGEPLNSCLFINGPRAYTEGYKEIDNICYQLYGNLPLVSNARSINIDDVNEVLDVKEEEIKDLDITGMYGEKYKLENEYTPESWLNGKEKITEEIDINGYMYYAGSKKNIEELPPQPSGKTKISNDRIINLLLDGAQRLGSGFEPYYYLQKPSTMNLEGVGFGVMGILEISIDDENGIAAIITSPLFSTEGDIYLNCGGVRPVICLDPNVKNESISRIPDEKEIGIWPNGMV